MDIVNKFLEERKSNLEPGEEKVLRQGAEMLQEMGMDMSRIIKQLDEGYLDNVSRDKVKEIINFMEDATGPDDDRWDDIMTLKYKIKNHQLCECKQMHEETEITNPELTSVLDSLAASVNECGEDSSNTVNGMDKDKQNMWENEMYMMANDVSEKVLDYITGDLDVSKREISAFIEKGKAAVKSVKSIIKSDRDYREKRGY